MKYLKKTYIYFTCFDTYGVVISATYLYFEEDIKGRLEKGKSVDLVILDENPLEVDSYDIKNIQVSETIKEDFTLYEIEKR